MNKIIATLGLSNTHGLAIWDINDDAVVIIMNELTIQNYKGVN